MKGKDVLFSSATDQWATPQDFFDTLDAEFHFNLDPCADETNHKCEEYFTKEQDGLKQSWGGVQSVLQSTIWTRSGEMGQEGVGGINKTGNAGRYAYSSPDRHKDVSRLHTEPGGNQVHQGAAKIRREQSRSTVPVYAGDFQSAGNVKYDWRIDAWSISDIADSAGR